MESIEPRDCPKCNENASVVPVKIASKMMICWKCSALFKDGDLGILEEISEFDLSLLEDSVREILTKLQAAVKGELKVDLNMRDIGRIGEIVGGQMSDALSTLRNSMAEKGVVPFQVLDNILLQAMIAMLSCVVAQLVRKPTDPKDDFKKRIGILRNGLNLAVKAFIEKFAPDATIVLVESEEE